MNPTQRSLDKLRKEGWEVCVVERMISFPPSFIDLKNKSESEEKQIKRRIDAFGFGDILGYRLITIKKICPTIHIINDRSTVLFQTTSGANFAARKKKIFANSKAVDWLKCGNGICLHGWRKLKNKKTGKYHWSCREEWITL